MIKFGKVEKQFQYKGHDCIIVFTHWGVRNGYISVSDDKDYTEYDIDCHGGLTFSGKLPYDYGQKKLYYIGFDCGHVCDANNYDLAYEYGLITAETRDRRKAAYFYEDATERTLEYVEDQCKHIVDQLEAMKRITTIKVEIIVPKGDYCDEDEDNVCPMIKRGVMGIRYCSLFSIALDKAYTDKGRYSKRCEKCKEAEVKDEQT